MNFTGLPKALLNFTSKLNPFETVFEDEPISWTTHVHHQLIDADVLVTIDDN